ncbi:MAG: Rrf2 family transcriptional regulator [Kaiparowitsia implicata GSE-PSE-MK54-09C]|nr:Rrf2 family transcriptional regulator [Kaiparowitsia implicata GSE-PSE-MK54-09C]
MDLSCKSEYALLALVELSAHYAEGEPIQIRQIAAEQHIPDRYLEQLLAALRRAGLVRSQRGAKGGYMLAREPWKITLLDVIQCIEGADAQSADRAKNPKSVAGNVILDVWKDAVQAAETLLKSQTLQDLVEMKDARNQVEIMYYI